MAYLEAAVRVEVVDLAHEPWDRRISETALAKRIAPSTDTSASGLQPAE
jgi:hypothetical protein